MLPQGSLPQFDLAQTLLSGDNRPAPHPHNNVTAPSPPSARAFAALHHPGYRAYFFTSALAMMADSVEHVISYWMMFQKFQSPALGGFAVIAHWLPFLLFSMHSGALADRFDPRRIIQLGMGLFMLVSVGWGFVFLSGAAEMWHAVLLLILHGLAGVLWMPSNQLLLHDIVGQEHLQSAIRLNATSRWLGLLMGPAVGAGIMLLMGATAGIFLNVLIYLPLVLWLWKAPFGPKFRKGKVAPHRALRGLADIASTLRLVIRHPTLFSMTLLAGGASLLVGNAYHAQMPEFAHDLGHGRADFWYSMLLAADAAGALVAGLALEARGLLRAEPRTAFGLALLWCAALGGFAMAPAYPIALALLFAAGFLELALYTMTQTLVQVHAPADARGRVIGLYAMSALGLRTFSGFTVGVLGSAVGIHLSLASSALVLLAVVAGLFVWSVRRSS